MALDFTRGPAAVDNLLATTFSEQKKELTEQWVNNNVVLKMLEKDAKEMIEGGVSIIEPIEYDDNDTVGWVGRNDTVPTTENEFLTHARFVWATIAGSLVVNDHDVAQNMGKNQIISLVDSKISNLQASMSDKLERALLASSTANINTINSLYDIVDASNPTLGSLGDISRATYTWWAATETASGSMATQGLEDIRTAEATVSRSMMDPVNIHITTQTLFNAYKARLTPYERLTDRSKADIEFSTVTFGGKPVIYSHAAVSGTWLGLNTKYFKFRINSNMAYKQQPWVRGEGKQYKSAIVQTQCQLTVTRPKSSFKLTGMTA